DRRDLPAAPRVASAVERAPRLLCPDDRPRLDRALFRPRRGAGLRPPLAARRSAAPVRRFVLVALVALAFPSAALAHATLESISPHFRKELQSGPKTIRLHFDQYVKLISPSAVKVLNANGKDFSLPAHTQGTNI